MDYTTHWLQLFVTRASYPHDARHNLLVVTMDDDNIFDTIFVARVLYRQRPGVFEHEVNWEEELSLGEKPRLAGNSRMDPGSTRMIVGWKATRTS